ncbi:MAG: TonB family protein [Bacteroidaceae bacterium]|nr:TonB family protein [Bacteroidaceae bacterium]
MEQLTTFHFTISRFIPMFIWTIGLFCSLPIKAQIFDFGYPRTERRQVPQEPVEPAKYKGGNAGLNRFLEKEFKRNPDKTDIQGQIVVACIINEKGKISETQISRSLDKDLDNEALRVIKKLKFKPAKQGKKAISSRINIVFPIRKGKVSFSTLKTIDV